MALDAAAVAELKKIIDAKNRFVAEVADPNDGEPSCGYAEFDETITDYARDVMETVEAALGG